VTVCEGFQPALGESGADADCAHCGNPQWAHGLIPGRLPFYCASCRVGFASRDGMYQDSKGLWQHDEEGGMSCCGPVLERAAE
jgi:hypothetical protein